MKLALILSLAIVFISSCAADIHRITQIGQCQFPVGVRTTTYALDPDLGEDVARNYEYASVMWKSASGGKLRFQRVGADEYPDIFITDGTYLGNGKVAETQMRCVNDALEITIIEHAPHDASTGPFFAAHELGHALGVAHSSDITSVMYPALSSFLTGEIDANWYRITASDVASALGDGQ